MSSTLFCCTAIQAFRPQYLSHESKFTSFMSWAAFPRESELDTVGQGNTDFAELNPPFSIQLVRQVNYGAIEWIKYFIPASNTSNGFVEVVEDDLLRANFQKLNSYKNFKCEAHNKFFELNVYQKDPVNKHHWRANMARPARDIDLNLRTGLPQTRSVLTTTATTGADDQKATKATADRQEYEDTPAFADSTKRMLSSTTAAEGSLDDDADFFTHHAFPFTTERIDDGSDKDFTACDKECGYCGHCDY